MSNGTVVANRTRAETVVWRVQYYRSLLSWPMGHPRPTLISVSVIQFAPVLLERG